MRMGVGFKGTVHGTKVVIVSFERLICCRTFLTDSAAERFAIFPSAPPEIVQVLVQATNPFGHGHETKCHLAVDELPRYISDSCIQYPSVQRQAVQNARTKDHANPEIHDLVAADCGRIE